MERLYFWNSYPFIRFSFALIAGIVSYAYIPGIWSSPAPVIAALFILLTIGNIVATKVGFYPLRHFNGLTVLIFLFYLGGWLLQQQYFDHASSHYTNYPSVHFYKGKIIDTVSKKEKYNRHELKLLLGSSNDSTFELTGNIYLYIRKDSTRHPDFNYGDELLVNSRIYPIPPPKNPSEFDYRSYLAKKNIYGQSFTDPSDIKSLESSSIHLLRYIFNLRKSALRIIDENIRSERENGIAKALLIGAKDRLDDEVTRSYASGGITHILAISGLHVGIIYLLIRFALGKLQNFLHGREIFGVVSVLTIWLFALITGLSPSVLRAATMFSLIAVSEVRNVQGNIYNTLGFAAFILLLFDPNLIYSVGFQLSFIAVFGIVYLQPGLYRLITVNNVLLDKIWALICVSLAAQIVTFPISAYYFHQFPSYFLISNLVAIPAATIILSLGILMFLFGSIIPTVGSLVGKLLYYVIWLLNGSVFAIEKLPHSLIEWIYLDKIEVFLIYGMLITLAAGVHFRSFKTLAVCALLFLALEVFRAHRQSERSSTRQIVFYESGKQTLVDYIQGSKACLFVDKKGKGLEETLSYQVDPYRLASGLSPGAGSCRTFEESENFRSFNSFTVGRLGDRQIIIIDSTTFHLSFDRPLRSDILIIENESVKSLKWLKDHFEFNHLVIGNKNSANYVKKMKEQAKAFKIILHTLRFDGAYIVPL